MPDRPCPNCGTMRPEAATFCSNCGQDLRPGASVGDMRPGATIVRKLPPGGAPGPRPARQGPPSALLGTPITPPATAPAAKAAAGSARPRMPRLGRSGASAAPKPAPTPTVDTRSFTDRYRGTTFETPETKAMAPAGSRERLVRLAGVVLVVVAIAAAAGYGALQVLSAPAGVDASPTGSAVALATATPVVTLPPAVTLSPQQQAQIAFCLAAQETRGLDADIAAVRASVSAAQHGAVATGATAVVTRVVEMRLAAREMAALTVLAQYAATYDANLKAVSSAASALAAAGSASDAKAEAKASTALVTAQTKVDATSTRTSLVAANPQLACTAAG